MQQVETFLCNGTSCDRKIACETVIEPSTQPSAQHQYDQDFPAESFYLKKEDELEWFNRNVFYDRNDSKKGTSTNSITNPNSQRFSVNLKSQKNSIIGLPKPQDARFVVSKVRPKGKPSTFRFFSKRYRSSNWSSEPSSPKVSCIGRVRSKRGKNRCQSNGSRAFEPERPGFWSNLKKKLQCSCRSGDVDERSTKAPSRRRTMTTEKRKAETSETAFEPPGLGGMNRFVSGRRSDSWAGDRQGGLKVDGGC